MNENQSSTFKIALRILLSILITFLILAISSGIGLTVIGPQKIETSPPWQMPAIIHLSMLILSFLLILILSKGQISSYGIKFDLLFPITRLLFICTGIGLVASAIESLIGTGGPSPTSGFSFFQKVIFIWFFASICEETLFRGLIQGLLSRFSGYGITILKSRLSLPVIVGALLFALIHLGLLGTGMRPLAVINIVIFAIVLGLIAGHYRESTGSLIPAIFVHICFNIGGTVIEYIFPALAGQLLS